jgi:hypothetical protein
MRVLHFAAEEAERLGHRYIRTEHLLLGLLRVEDGLAAKVLVTNKVSLSGIREAIANMPWPMSKTADGRHYAPVRMPAPTEAPSIFLKDFLKHLRTGAIDFEGFLDSDSQYVDAAGKHWFGDNSLAKNLKERARTGSRAVRRSLPRDPFMVQRTIFRRSGIPADDYRRSPRTQQRACVARLFHSSNARLIAGCSAGRVFEPDRFRAPALLFGLDPPH